MDALLQSRAQELATEFASQATTVEELNELVRLMMKSGLERMLDTEMDVHLGRRPVAEAASTSSPPLPTGEKRRSPNRRNGRSRKTVQGDLGEVTALSPRSLFFRESAGLLTGALKSSQTVAFDEHPPNRTRTP